MQCFLRLAEELHFSRAAEKQGMAQSTMSQQIQNLEEELGARVFFRNSKKVQLTPAGEFLKREFAGLIENYEGIMHEARRISGLDNDRLVVGYHGPFNSTLFNPIFQSFKSAHPETELSLIMENWGNIPGKIVSEQIDIGFLEGSEIYNNSKLESFFLARDYVCFAIHKSHRLAEKSILRPEDIKGEPLVMVDSAIGKKSIETIHKRLIQGGVDIRKGVLVNNFESCMAMVSSGIAISPMPISFKQTGQNEIVFIEYDSTTVYVDIYMAWSKGNCSTGLSKFIDSVKTLYSNRETFGMEGFKN